MTDIKKKALALVEALKRDELTYDQRWKLVDLIKTQAREIEQHEAFRQEVSDAVERVFDECEEHIPFAPKQKLRSFILPKPDPLVEVIADYKRTKGTGEYATNKDMAAALRAALAARGLEVRKIGGE